MQQCIDGRQAPVRILHENGIQRQERCVEDKANASQTAHSVGDALVLFKLTKQDTNDVKCARKLRNPRDKDIARGTMAAESTERDRRRDGHGVANPEPVGNDWHAYRRRRCCLEVVVL